MSMDNTTLPATQTQQLSPLDKMQLILAALAGLTTTAAIVSTDNYSEKLIFAVTMLASEAAAAGVSYIASSVIRDTLINQADEKSRKEAEVWIHRSTVVGLLIGAAACYLTVKAMDIPLPQYPKMTIEGNDGEDSYDVSILPSGIDWKDSARA